MAIPESRLEIPLHSCESSGFHLEGRDHEIEAIPKILHIGLQSKFWQEWESDNIPAIWVSPRTITLTDVTTCYVSGLDEPDTVREFGANKTLRFKHPKRVEEIHFEGLVSQKQFDKLVLPLTNLKLLELHISSLENLRLTSKLAFLTYLRLPLLESLQISSHNFNPDHAANSNIDKIINNCCMLLQKLFPNLNFLAVSLPLVRIKEDLILESILKSLKLHKRTLKSLNVESTFEIQLKHIDETTVPIRLQNLNQELASVKEIQLHSFHYFSTHKTPGTVFWRKFLLTQKRLEYFQYWCGQKYFPLPTVLILHNFRHLHTVALNINPASGTYQGAKRHSVDCTAFHHCSLLKTLVLKGKPTSRKSEPGSSLPPRKKSDFANFKRIPRGLEHIRLIHLGLKKPDASLIAREIPHLSILYLEDIGEENGLGLAMDDLAYLLKKKTLQTLDVHSGINKASINEISDESSGGFGAVARILFKTHNPQSFRAVLGQNGEYDIVDEADFANDEEGVFHEDEIIHQDEAGSIAGIDEDVNTDTDLESQLSDEEENEPEPRDAKRFNEYKRFGFGSINPIDIPSPSESLARMANPRRRQVAFQNPVQSYNIIHEEDERTSGSSSENEEVEDFSPQESFEELNVREVGTEMQNQNEDGGIGGQSKVFGFRHRE